MSIVILILTFFSVALADVPQFISYQGILRDDLGAPIEGTYPITFRLYDDEISPTSIWTETHPAVEVTEGLYSVQLGSLNPFSPSIDFSEQYWLEVEFNSTVLSPRYMFSSSPYALNIADVINKEATQTFTGAIGNAILVDSPGYDGLHIENGGDDGIEIDSVRWYGLWVRNSGSFGVYVQNPHNAGVRVVNPVYNGVEIAGSEETNRGVYIYDYSAYGDPDTGIVVRNVGSMGIFIDSPEGTAEKITGAETGLYITDSEWGIIVSEVDSEGISIYNPTRNGINIQYPGNTGISVLSPGNNGIEITGGVTGLDVFGYAATGRGVYIHGTSGDPDTGIVVRNCSHYAAWFEGNVHVTGRLDKGSGSFFIDHPLDPLNKTLRHNFVESPENLCLYRGEVELDSKGEAVVEMPDYFTALVEENGATVTPTPVGRPFMVGYEWDKNRNAFTVYGKPGRRVSYIVLADRDDPVMRMLYRPVEEDKGERSGVNGLLYPEAYGYPEEMGED